MSSFKIACLLFSIFVLLSGQDSKYGSVNRSARAKRLHKSDSHAKTLICAIAIYLLLVKPKMLHDCREGLRNFGEAFKGD